MTDSVPSWAFWVTALIALIGPLVTTHLNNKYQARRDREAQEHQRQERRYEHKAQAYSNALGGINEVLRAQVEPHITGSGYVLETALTATDGVFLHGSLEARKAALNAITAIERMAKAIEDSRLLDMADAVGELREAKVALSDAASDDLATF